MPLSSSLLPKKKTMISLENGGMSRKKCRDGMYSLTRIQKRENQRRGGKM
jgi:hypothetical protein